MKPDYNSVIFRAIFAGVFISIAAWGYLTNPVIGMFLFSVGLIGVIKYKLGLFTGTAGFIDNGWDALVVLLILIFNFFGCMLFAGLTHASPMYTELQSTAMMIIQSRIENGWLKSGLLAIGCGILMSFAVVNARFAEKQVNESFSNWLPLLFAVPAFILCGFPHCIADAFYFWTAYLDIPIINIPWEAWRYYLSIVVGNLIGCNMYRCFIW